jgi:hypothetical protein
LLLQLENPAGGLCESDRKREGNRASEKFVMVFLFVPYRLFFRRNLLAWQKRLVRSTFSWSQAFVGIKLTLDKYDLKRPTFNGFSHYFQRSRCESSSEVCLACVMSDVQKLGLLKYFQKEEDYFNS